VRRRRLTRAHLALLARPAAASQGRQLLEAVCRALGEELRCPVAAEGRLVAGTAHPAEGPATACATALLEVDGAAGGGLLEVELPFLVALLEKLAGGEGRRVPAMALTRIEEATLAYVVLVALAAVRGCEGLARWPAVRLLGLTLERAAAARHAAAHAPHLAVEVLLRVGGLEGAVRLLLPVRALAAALEDLPVAGAEAPAPGVLPDGLSLGCRVGRSPVSLPELARLDPGDVVLFPGVRKDARGRLLGAARLTSGLFVLEGELTPEGFSGVHARARAPLQQEVVMRSVVVDVEGPTRAGGELPVEVEIELARVQLPLADLLRLQPGGVLPLGVGASEPVVLRVGERAVARAELVDIEGEVGARILSLLP
jgi:type III secretion protein Q